MEINPKENPKKELLETSLEESVSKFEKIARKRLEEFAKKYKKDIAIWKRIVSDSNPQSGDGIFETMISRGLKGEDLPETEKTQIREECVKVFSKVKVVDSENLFKLAVQIERSLSYYPPSRCVNKQIVKLLREVFTRDEVCGNIRKQAKEIQDWISRTAALYQQHNTVYLPLYLGSPESRKLVLNILLLCATSFKANPSKFHFPADVLFLFLKNVHQLENVKKEDFLEDTDLLSIVKSPEKHPSMDTYPSLQFYVATYFFEAGKWTIALEFAQVAESIQEALDKKHSSFKLKCWGTLWKLMGDCAHQIWLQNGKLLTKGIEYYHHAEDSCCYAEKYPNYPFSNLKKEDVDEIFKRLKVMEEKCQTSEVQIVQ